PRPAPGEIGRHQRSLPVVGMDQVGCPILARSSDCKLASTRKRFPASPPPSRLPLQPEKPAGDAAGGVGMTIPQHNEVGLTGCFADLRVLDFSTTIAGPHCARMLADMGAEVIKIETADGETMRTRPPVRNGCSTPFGQLNVGKKSLVLDLKSKEGLEAVRRLVVRTDVLVENFRPGVMRRLKLDYAAL